MKPGDLVKFSDRGRWNESLSGKVGLVIDVRQIGGATIFDAVVDNKLWEGCSDGRNKIWEENSDYYDRMKAQRDVEIIGEP